MRSWKSFGFLIVAFVAWFFGLAWFSEYNIEDEYLWLSISATAIGVASSIFWRFESRNWYWYTVLSLFIANIIVGILAWPRLNTLAKSVIQLIGMADCLISVGIFRAVEFLASRFSSQSQ